MRGFITNTINFINYFFNGISNQFLNSKLFFLPFFIIVIVQLYLEFYLKIPQTLKQHAKSILNGFSTIMLYKMIILLARFVNL